VRRYFAANPPPGTLFAKAAPRLHVVRRGDTLSHIAKRYGVTMASLRQQNGLRNDNILIGKELTIPGSDDS
jgi:N-acetylmuramoyl-L-alanine amidase